MDILRTGVDYNFLRIFSAVMEERSIARASQRVGVSASAISHALAAMRTQFDDDLFVRTANGMQPTPRAMDMASHVQAALQAINRIVAPPEFEPQHSTLTIVVAANDLVTAIDLPNILAQTFRDAPQISVIIRPSTRRDLAEELDLGVVDFAVSDFVGTPDRFSKATLGADREMAVTGPGHPLAGTRLTAQDLASHPLAAFALEEHDSVAGAMSARGMERQVDWYNRTALEYALREVGGTPRFRLTVPHYMALPDLLRGSDMIAIVPGRLARFLHRTQGFVSFDLPYAVQPRELQIVWHRRNDKSAHHVWFRNLMIGLGAAGDRPGAGVGAGG